MIPKNLKPFYSSFLLALCLILSQSCKKEQQTTNDVFEIPKAEPVIEIVTEAMDFQMQDTIPSGWNTFRYINKSPQTHFFLIDKYPEGKTSKDAEELVAPVFDAAMKLIMEGKTEEGFAEFAKLPEWFQQVKFVGGSGLVSPDYTATTTLNLKPGKYIMECYVKMSNGVFHTSMGMTKDIVVDSTDSGLEPPKANINISISSENGINLLDSITSGKNVFKVTYIDQITHENFVGHDVNLVKIDEGEDMTKLEGWMNWASPEGLIEPAPQGFTFMGGVNDLPQGEVGYFTASLSSGTYALISEVPNPSDKNMLKTFVIK